MGDHGPWSIQCNRSLDLFSLVLNQMEWSSGQEAISIGTTPNTSERNELFIIFVHGFMLHVLFTTIKLDFLYNNNNNIIYYYYCCCCTTSVGPKSPTSLPGYCVATQHVTYRKKHRYILPKGPRPNAPPPKKKYVTGAGSPRESQGVPGSPRVSQGVPGSPRESQGVPGSPRESQGVPGSRNIHNQSNGQ